MNFTFSLFQGMLNYENNSADFEDGTQSNMSSANQSASKVNETRPIDLQRRTNKVIQSSIQVLCHRLTINRLAYLTDTVCNTTSNGQYKRCKNKIIELVGWLCLTSHRQRGHLETAPPFTVPCEGREAR